MEPNSQILPIINFAPERETRINVILEQPQSHLIPMMHSTSLIGLTSKVNNSMCFPLLTVTEYVKRALAEVLICNYVQLNKYDKILLYKVTLPSAAF